jgi:hypothetical protein
LLRAYDPPKKIFTSDFKFNAIRAMTPATSPPTVSTEISTVYYLKKQKQKRQHLITPVWVPAN